MFHHNIVKGPRETGSIWFTSLINHLYERSNKKESTLRTWIKKNRNDMNRTLTNTKQVNQQFDFKVSSRACSAPLSSPPSFSTLYPRTYTAQVGQSFRSTHRPLSWRSQSHHLHTAFSLCFRVTNSPGSPGIVLKG